MMVDMKVDPVPEQDFFKPSTTTSTTTKHRTMLSQSAPTIPALQQTSDRMSYTKKDFATLAGFYLGPMSPRSQVFEELRIPINTQVATNEGGYSPHRKKKRQSCDDVASIFKSVGLYPRYVYECDISGRVVGGKIPLHGPLAKDIERLLVVGQHGDDKYFNLIRD